MVGHCDGVARNGGHKAMCEVHLRASPDAGYDDGACPLEIDWRRRVVQIGVNRGERFAHRCQVARLVIDQGDHSSPLVLGSIRASRLSFAHATRSARANALNTAST